MIVYFIQKNRGNYNSPNYLNIMVYYHYHGENRIITRKLPFMPIIQNQNVSQYNSRVLIALTSRFRGAVDAAATKEDK